VERRIAVLLATAGLAVATWGLATAATAIPDTGVHFEPSPGRVLWVLPGGSAWRDRVRVGQTVTAIVTGTTALDWALVTSDGSAEYRVTEAGATATLRGWVPLAAIALLASLLATAASIRIALLASAVGVLAGAAGSIPLTFVGDPVVSTLGGLLALAFPLGWLASQGRGSGRVRLMLVVAGLALGTAWLIARLEVPEVYDVVDALRLAGAALLALAVVVLAVDPDRIRAGIRAAEGPVALDLLGAGIAMGVAVAFWLVVGLSGIVAAVVAGIAALLYLRTRRPLARAIDHALFAEREGRASIAAVEAERGRLARDIHDEPLQALSASIRRLETTPDPKTEAARLREVAAQLRSVATDLYPPILEDLGLGPALAFLVERANVHEGTIPVSMRIDDRAGRSPGERLSRDVEAALYHIAQEAIGNAQRHSGGSRIEVTGRLRPDLAELSVVDDGIGLSSERAERTERDGRHMGLRSMRGRSAAIDADLDIAVGPAGGTAVTVRWPGR
jgi:signal transduction histidine kinase